MADERDDTPVRVLCGRCGNQDTMPRWVILTCRQAWPPHCLCGRYDWRFGDGTPIPFMLPYSETTARIALGAYGADRMPVFPRADNFDHHLYRSRGPRLGSPPPTVCTCGHTPDDHTEDARYCMECICPLLELDADR